MGALCVWGLWVGYTAPGHHIYKWIQARKRCPLKKKGWPARKQAASSPVSLIFIYLFFSPWSLEWGKEGLRASGIGWPRTLGTAAKCFVVIQSRSCVWLCDHVNYGTPGFPALSLPAGVCSDSWLMCWWCHLTILTSVAPFSALNLSQHQGLFQWIGSSHQVSSVLELQLQHQSFHWIFWVDFL